MQTRSGYGTVFPYMMCDNAVQLIAFLEAAFDAVELHRVPNESGGIRNSQVQIGDTRFMVSSGARDPGPMPGSYYIYVDDADSTVAKALANGATLIMEVADMPYGDRQGGIKDPSGNIWWVSQRIFDEEAS